MKHYLDILGSLEISVLVGIAITFLAITPTIAFGQYDITVDLEKIETLFDEEKYEEVLSYVEEILKKDRKNEDALINKGIALYYLDDELDAIKYFDKVIAINQDNDEAFYNKARALYVLERYDEALTNVNKSIEINPENISALNRKGIILYRLENYQDALNFYDQVLAIDPNRISALDRKGMVLAALGNIEDAIIFYNKALRLEVNNTSALYNKGNALFDLERYEEAVEYYDKVLEIDYDEDTFYNKSDALKNLGINELGSTIFLNEMDKGTIYETFGPIIHGTPLVCAVEFESDLLTKNDVDRIMKETTTAVSEWEIQLKNAERIKDKKNIWEIDFTVVLIDKSSVYDYSKCDVTIRFMDIPEDPDLQLYAYGIAMPNELNKKQADIEIYLTKLTTCFVYLEKVGNVQYYSNDPCYSDRARGTDVIATTVRHELGHALGLGHYYSEDAQTTSNWSNGNSPAPSLMVRFSLDNENLQRIRTVDIEMLRTIYSENGFLGNSKVPQVETASNPFEKIEVDEVEIPDWVRNNAEWWVQGTIGDSDFTTGIQYLIKQGIVQIPDTVSSGDGGSQEIPGWIKNNAGWWAQGLISDNDFVKGIQYLVEQGIIQVS